MKRQSKIQFHKSNTFQDLIFVALLISLGPFLTLLFNLKPLIGGLFLTIPASIYMIITRPKHLPKITVAVLVFGFLMGFVFDFIETLNGGWSTTRLVFPNKIFGVEPIDNILGYGLMTLLVITFYEHFIHHQNNNKISKHLAFAIVPFLLSALTIIVSFNRGLTALHIPYIYFIGGLVAIVFPVSICLYRPKLIIKYFYVGIFFAFVWFFSEIAALKTGGWIFPGEYIGTISIFGVIFPLEEFIFWMLLYSGSLIAYYEFFIEGDQSSS